MHVGINKRALLIAVTIIIVIIGGAILYSMYLSSNDNRSPNYYSPQVNQVKIKVHYSGSWSGAYGDAGSIQSWSGTGDYSLTLNRPSSAISMWIISANAQKQDDSTTTLTISIVTMDGSVLKTASTTAAYGVAQVAVDVGS